MKKWMGRIAIGVLAGMILFVGVTYLRMQLVRYQIRQDRGTTFNSAPVEIGETGALEILPLYENASADGLQSGHGVSYLVRTDNATILFDLGNNMTAASPSPLLQNMAALGVSLDEIDAIVISHRHPDHVGGQNWWTQGTFSLDGATQTGLGGMDVYIPEAMTYPGVDPSLSTVPVKLSDGIATTGIIAYAQPFPVWLATPSGDEQALAVHVSGRGIILITGCGHMGLAALLARAEAVFAAPVVGVIGGLHYGNADLTALQPELDLVRELNPVVVALSPHDSGQPALDGFAQTFPAAYTSIAVGQPIRVAAKNAAP